MSQRWYSYSGVFIPGTRARAEDVANEFTLVQNAIANIDTYGTDSGSANAYVITTDTVPWTSYAEPRVITFKANAGNTGASTININGIGAVGLKRFNGQALQSGDVLAGHWYTAAYNATTGVFEITSPAQATTAGTISYAAPTGKATLAASLGVLSTVAPSDSNIAIDLTISPTWTALHTFSAGVDVTGTVAVTGGITATTTIAATGAISGSNLSATGGANPSASVGLTAVNGTAKTYMSSDSAPALSQAITPTWTALHTFSAGLSSTSVVVTGAAVPANGIYLPAVNTLGFAANTTAVGSLTTAVLTMPALAVTGATVPANGIYLPSANALGFATNTVARGTISSTGGWTINAPTSGTPLTVAVTGNNTQAALIGNINITTGQLLLGGSSEITANGLPLSIGTNGAAAFGLYTNATQRISIAATGQVSINAPSSGAASLLVQANPGPVAAILQNTLSTSYTSLRLYNDQNLNTRALEIDYAGSGYGSVIATNGPVGEQGAIGTNGAYPLVFYTAGVYRMQLLGSGIGAGSLVVGAAPSLATYASVVINAGNGRCIDNVMSSASNAQTFNVGGTQVGSISCTASATAYNVSSDVRLKKNIVDAPEAGETLDAVRVRSFDWKHSADHTDYGFVAQELIAYVPSAVTKGAVWGVDYSKLVPLLVKEIQSVRRRLAALDNPVR